MRRRFPTDFRSRRKQHSETRWYDVEFDRILIEQSVAKQYGILPSKQAQLHYVDWAKLVGGLMEDTPLGREVSIRSETDPERLRQFTPSQQESRRAWRAWLAGHSNTPAEREKVAALEEMMARMFGGEKNSKFN